MQYIINKQNILEILPQILESVKKWMEFKVVLANPEEKFIQQMEKERKKIPFEKKVATMKSKEFKEFLSEIQS